MSLKVINVEATCSNLKRLCKEKNVTPKQIADTMGFTTVAAVYKWFSGKNIPSIDSLVVISYMLDCTLEEILVVDQVEL